MELYTKVVHVTCLSRMYCTAAAQHRAQDKFPFGTINKYICIFYVLFLAFCTFTAMQSAQWYSWGPPNMQCRLCVSCWMYWKKYGGLKMPSRAEGPEERTSPVPAGNVSSVRKRTHVGEGSTPQTFKLLNGQFICSFS